MDIEEETKKLTKRAKKIEIDDKDSEDFEKVSSAFPQHLQVIESGSFGGPKRAKTGASLANVIYSAASCDQLSVVCGMTNGQLKVIDPNRLTDSFGEAFTRRHGGLTCLKCSRTNPQIFYSSSDTGGTILLWDIRESASKASQKFTPTPGTDNNTTASGVKPILTFDVSVNDQLLSAGTELIKEDSFVLFWDIRSCKLLGAYWESHSDDITTVKFHETETTSLASGSTDGLLNVFNLLEQSEDDALLYSFNTESSVESVSWNKSTVTCVTHTNNIQVWDTVSGDRVVEFNRESIAEAMMIRREFLLKRNDDLAYYGFSLLCCNFIFYLFQRSNPEAAHVNGCYNNNEILTCSLSGNCARVLEYNELEKRLTPKSIFMDQFSVIQTAQYLDKSQKWITFDEDGIIKTWSAKESSTKGRVMTSKITKKRHKPY